jgi:hypothetical protein
LGVVNLALKRKLTFSFARARRYIKIARRIMGDPAGDQDDVAPWASRNWATASW